MKKGPRIMLLAGCILVNLCIPPVTIISWIVSVALLFCIVIAYFDLDK